MNLLTCPRLLGALTLIAQAAAAQVVFTPVAIIQCPVPGLRGAEWVSFGPAALNARGEVAFYAEIRGPGVGPHNDAAIWAGPPAAPAVLARTGSQPPGLGAGAMFCALDDPALGARGDVAFGAEITGVGVGIHDNTGIWSGPLQAVQLIARKSGFPPGLPGTYVEFIEFGLPVVNAGGAVAFHATIRGEGVAPFSDTGIWAGGADGLQLLAREGGQPRGLGAGAQFRTLTQPTISATGAVAFHATVDGLGIGRHNDTGIWTGPAGAVRLAAREGNQPPGTASGVMFGSFGDVAMGAAGPIAFGATLIGVGVGPKNDTGLWAGTPGAIRLVAREDSTPPGAVDGSSQFESFGLPALSAGRQIAFRATLRGVSIHDQNREGIWAGLPGAPKLCARAGTHAPGTANGDVFLNFADPLFTAAGTVAFQATLLGPGTGSHNSVGIWAGAPAGSLQLIVREGDFLHGGDRVRQIAPGGLTLFRHQGGDGLNASGTLQLAFQASFTDGRSGLFVATVSAPTARRRSN